MINHREIRIGNIFLYKGIHSRVTSVNVNDEIEFEPNTDAPANKELNSEPHPIPLSDAILKKLGLNKLSNGWHQIGQINYGLNSKQICIYQNENEKVTQVFLDVRIEYLHQLQNFYFIWTGKELEANLKVAG